MTTQAYVVESAGKEAILKEIELQELGDNDVEVGIEYCGICASDVDVIDGKYGPLTVFPLVAGHEGVGVVKQIGKNVTAVSVGDHVGVGVTRFSCGYCDICSSGRDNICPDKQSMFLRGAGTGPFGAIVRLNEQYAFPLPSNIDMSTAGPLMCAGISVFAPFLENNINSTHRVGVVGIGGLGHLALQFSRAMGCHTTAISRSSAKKEEAMKFGANSYIDSSCPESVKAAAASCDYILVTAGGPSVDYTQLLSVLAPNGTILLAGNTGMTIGPLPMYDLILGQKGIRGSASGSRIALRKMLKFAALHDIKPQCEIFPVSEINNAFKKVREGTARYRCVVKW
eukprot:TRINITY_DN3479_c2_g1_i1.p1 TRINITY_DN3479_c2_g1~~TRINITY_DN3479_c2_g1_i1.p1  ORF type:complete len:340 (+),score=69.24 TRINITY_DN3479_c2_g1_i1:64-1083(+)